jgi:hypothetical protein
MGVAINLQMLEVQERDGDHGVKEQSNEKQLERKAIKMGGLLLGAVLQG